ncbi:hypothetical protein [Okeania sp. SIO1F9]|uniref:hypothetical protein n=1 Tax=Okeania sp. SIO1F9 TaxID=2607813 RepID=UPI00144CBAA6|nr:hypothetical protein [Okeania sp. SIO1F9]NET76708.1 hypothetical protein [Okeania sp. SIO1F9]
MANINISDLRPAGADLFLDSQSYLNDLTEVEMTNTLGGINPMTLVANVVFATMIWMKKAY